MFYADVCTIQPDVRTISRASPETKSQAHLALLYETLDHAFVADAILLEGRKLPEGDYPMAQHRSGDSADERIGDFLVKIGAMTDSQRNEVLLRQEQEPDRMFGEIAIELGYIDDSAVDRYLSQRK